MRVQQIRLCFSTLFTWLWIKFRCPFIVLLRPKGSARSYMFQDVAPSAKFDMKNCLKYCVEAFSFFEKEFFVGRHFLTPGSVIATFESLIAQVDMTNFVVGLFGAGNESIEQKMCFIKSATFYPWLVALSGRNKRRINLVDIISPRSIARQQARNLKLPYVKSVIANEPLSEHIFLLPSSISFKPEKDLFFSSPAWQINFNSICTNAERRFLRRQQRERFIFIFAFVLASEIFVWDGSDVAHGVCGWTMAVKKWIYGAGKERQGCELRWNQLNSSERLNHFPIPVAIAFLLFHFNQHF